MKRGARVSSAYRIAVQDDVGMSYAVQQLRELSTEDLIAAHDELAKTRSIAIAVADASAGTAHTADRTAVHTNNRYKLTEAIERQNAAAEERSARTTERMQDLTNTIARLTWVIAAATLVSTIAVLTSVCPRCRTSRDIAD